jgi:hypothetical protein
MRTNTLIPNFLSKFFVLLGFALHVFKLTLTSRTITSSLLNLTLFDVLKYLCKKHNTEFAVNNSNGFSD